MSNLNPEILKQKLAALAEKVLVAQKQSVNEGMIELLAEFKDRIFYKGENTDGGSIGQYSKNPLYVSLDSQTSQVRKSGLKPRGKKKGENKAARSSKTVTTIKRFRTDEDDFTSKVTRERKSMYFPDGYSGYRSAVGRQNSKVDLFLTGDMSGSINLGARGEIVTIEFRTDKQVEKAEGNEKRFGKTIFSASEQELDIVVDLWEKETTEAFLTSFE